MTKAERHPLSVETAEDEALARAVDEGIVVDPHAFLGSHPLNDQLHRVRVYRPLAQSVGLEGDSHMPDLPLTHEGFGVWVGLAPGPARPHRIRARYSDSEWVTIDPYGFTPSLGEFDLHLISEGRHEQLWHALGANLVTHQGIPGVRFAVWAPNARAVRLSGDMNRWDSRLHPMRSLGSSGVWELFVPDARRGQRYKFDVLGKDGLWRLKADPMARAAEHPPATASVITASQFDWNDAEWLAQRRAPHAAPMSIYEVHLGSWRSGMSYRRAAVELVDYVRTMGFTHVEFLPLAEHPYGPSWGYQVSGYYAPTARYGEPDELRLLIDALHRAGIGVILDWVPAHFPKDDFALARFDGSPLYEHPDPRRGEHPDWGTYIFDYGRPEVRGFLMANALYWLDEFHIDALRVDAVASMLYLDYSRSPGEWVPNHLGGRENLEAVSLLQHITATAYRGYPGVSLIAEESTAWPGVTAPTDQGGLGFGFKWNMGWMHDSLQYVARDPVHRSFHHREITHSLSYAWSENFVLPISHDEVVHGKKSLAAKMPGDQWQKLAQTRAYLAFMWAHPGKKLLFMGQELGQLSEWSESRELDWWVLDQPANAALARYVAELNRIYRHTPALFARDEHPDGFGWIEQGDAGGNVVAFLRREPGGSTLALLSNFANQPHYSYRIGLPQAGRWYEVLNSDAREFGGSGVGNLGAVTAENIPHGGYPASAVLNLPPLGALWLMPVET